MESQEVDCDVLFMECDEMPKPFIESSTRKCKKRKKKNTREVNRPDGDMDTVNITQGVDCKEEKLNYIIKINTDIPISGRKSCAQRLCKKHRKKNLKHSIHKEKNIEKRIVPTCLRRKCEHSIKLKSKDCKLIRQRKIQKSMKHNKSNERHRILLSPVFSSPLRFDDNLSYENTSDDSWDDDTLDSLIKRTKEREKQNETSELHSNRRLFKRTLHKDITSNEEPVFSDIHSLPTVILNNDELDNAVYSSTGCDHDMFDNEKQLQNLVTVNQHSEIGNINIVIKIDKESAYFDHILDLKINNM